MTTQDGFDDVPHPADLEEITNVVAFDARKQRGRKRQRAESDERPADSDLPVIQMSSKLHEAVDASVGALACDSEVYQRDGRLVRVVLVAAADAKREQMSAGTPQIRPVLIPTLRERLTRLATYQRYDSRAGEWVNTLPSGNVVQAVEARGEWPGIRPLVGVIETPSMRPDGTVFDTPGYDAATGYIYAPSRTYPKIPHAPTRDDARRALAALAEPFAEFPTASKAQHFVPVAALMTIIARPAIQGACPAFLFDASTRGSGKSLQQAAITILAQGREAALLTWRDNQEEIEKILGAQAMKGASVVCWDNVCSEFGGGPLDKVLTCADRIELRILGKTEVPSVEWRAVMLAGGNNMTIGGDTTRRVLVCRLEPMMEKPEERTGYAIGDLKSWCRDHHARIVAAALTVLRAYVVSGRESQGLAGWGSFEAWRDLIGNAIVWAGGPDVMECRPTVSGDDDPVTGALRTLMEQLPAFSKTGCSISLMLQSLFSPERMRGNAPPDGFDALREAIETLAPPKPGQAPVAIRVAGAFRKARRRVIGGRYLDVAGQDGHSKVAVWLVKDAGQ